MIPVLDLVMTTSYVKKTYVVDYLCEQGIKSDAVSVTVPYGSLDEHINFAIEKKLNCGHVKVIKKNLVWQGEPKWN